MCLSKGTNIDLNHITDTDQHEHSFLPYFLSASEITGSVREEKTFHVSTS